MYVRTAWFFSSTEIQFIRPFEGHLIFVVCSSCIRPQHRVSNARSVSPPPIFHAYNPCLTPNTNFQQTSHIYVNNSKHILLALKSTFNLVHSVYLYGRRDFIPKIFSLIRFISLDSLGCHSVQYYTSSVFSVTATNKDFGFCSFYKRPSDSLKMPVSVSFAPRTVRRVLSYRKRLTNLDEQNKKVSLLVDVNGVCMLRVSAATAVLRTTF